VASTSTTRPPHSVPTSETSNRYYTRPGESVPAQEAYYDALGYPQEHNNGNRVTGAHNVIFVSTEDSFS
jgi:hypothetical protein